METNISSEIFTQHLFAWLFVLIALLALAYTMKIIKKEKEIFIDNAVMVELGPYTLQVPSWWSITEQNENYLRFERTDTRYDWFAIFKLNKLAESSLSIVEEFTSEIHDRKLLFDSDAGIIHEPDSIKRHALENAEVARVEGTATQDGMERIYYDAMLARDHDLKKRLWAESRSSVLDGGIEGPYFEYVIQNVLKN